MSVELSAAAAAEASASNPNANYVLTLVQCQSKPYILRCIALLKFGPEYSDTPINATNTKTFVVTWITKRGRWLPPHDY